MFLGIDIGSVSIKYAIIDKKEKIVEKAYFRTYGDIISALKNLIQKVKNINFFGVAVTGSGREFVKSLISADLSIDEITAHRFAINILYPDVNTIIEIGGQDSKLIYKSKNFIGFEMNNVCAAGTGSFLDQQASRFNMSIEDFFKLGLSTNESYKITSKCTVFAESDMIHAQQSGISKDKIIRGLHRGLISNYYSQMCLGKKLMPKFLFEGGTSNNDLLVEELSLKLIAEKLIQNKDELIIPRPYNLVIGAIGSALLCKRRKIQNLRKIPAINKFEYLEDLFCTACPNKCMAKISRIKVNNKIVTLGKSCQT